MSIYLATCFKLINDTAQVINFFMSDLSTFITFHYFSVYECIFFRIPFLYIAHMQLPNLHLFCNLFHHSSNIGQLQFSFSYKSFCPPKNSLSFSPFLLNHSYNQRSELSPKKSPKKFFHII